jgi:hypothetical protein
MLAFVSIVRARRGPEVSGRIGYVRRDNWSLERTPFAASFDSSLSASRGASPLRYSLARAYTYRRSDVRSSPLSYSRSPRDSAPRLESGKGEDIATLAREGHLSEVIFAVRSRVKIASNVGIDYDDRERAPNAKLTREIVLYASRTCNATIINKQRNR